MPSPRMPRYIQSSSDLVTSRDLTRAGFLSQALAKTEKATPYVEEAHALLIALKGVDQPDRLLSIAKFRSDLISAAGFSEKARGHLGRAELDAEVRKVLATIATNAGSQWREALLYRYLLTKGDTLGGKMRNWTGAAAQQKLTTALLAALTPAQRATGHVRASDETGKIQEMGWSQRLLVFDRKPRWIGNNVDAILVNRPNQSTEGKELLENPAYYVACGELKGGIDPAGADEHWKTANTAFERIRAKFNDRNMQVSHLFYVGAAIEPMMAQTIYGDLRTGRLSHAANLNVQEQLSDLADWLVAL